METNLTNIQAKAFLVDYEKNSHIELLEGSKQNEVLKIAKARGIQLKNNMDLSGFKSIYTIADITDSNGQIIPKKKLLKVLPTLIGKPINLLHQRKYVVGHYIDYKFINKTNQVISYGVFYRSNFAKEWETVKAFFKNGQLGMSSEIWSPKNSWKYLKDGSFILGEISLAGGALVYPPDVPAVPGADVLALAKKTIDVEYDVDLIFSTKYKDDEILTADTNVEVVGVTDKVAVKEEKPEFFNKKELDENSQPIENKPVTEKIECENCKTQFLSIPGQNKCPKCDAILNERGQVLYPPQNINFSLNCLDSACRSNNWLVLSRNSDITKIKCLSCSKEYEVSFKKQEDNLTSSLSFVYSCRVSCPQCSKSVVINGVSNVPERSIKCQKCGLTFPVSVGEYKRDIIENIKEIEMVKSTDNPEGGITMKNDKITKEEIVEVIPEETKEELETSVEKPVEEVVAEVVEKVEEVKNEEVPEVPAESVEAPKAEETVEPVVVVEEEVKSIIKEEAISVDEVKPADVNELVEEKPVVSTEAKFVTLYRERIKRLLNLVREISMSTSDELVKASETVKFYKEKSLVVSTRRDELGKYADTLTDVQIVDDEKYELAKSIKDDVETKEAVEKANETDISTASVKISTKDQSDLDKAKDEINKNAFGHVKIEKK